jgi:hypothetical protein
LPKERKQEFRDGAGMSTMLAYTRNEVFDPDATQAMAAAFDAAWESLRETRHIATAPFKAEATRERLAKAILEQARNGERDPIRLQEHAIKGLAARY